MENKRKDILKRFGKYLLLDHLVDGGMAKICRARYLGEEADRIVAIKMIQPQYSQDENFKTMFLNEIKVTFGLIHPNIVQTYDYGISDERLYVAMEYCDGKNLKEYLEKLKKRNFVFPVDISVHIITQVCQGLHYAHNYSDKMSGKEINIIHRDISPHNIMLTYDGAIKVIDFGIAKAETNQDATKVGTIKGKLSYIAPEYIEGQTLDQRYDQFAVGITLWELLCSKKLFNASNDLAILKLIQECKIPAPSLINPNVPEELDRIVLKALSKDRNKRFENMDQMNRELVKFLYKNYEEFNSSDLGYFAKELFSEDIEFDKEVMVEYGKMDISKYLNDIKKERHFERSKKVMNEGQKAQETHILDFGFEDDKTKIKSHTKLNNRAPKPMQTMSYRESDGKKLDLKSQKYSTLPAEEKKVFSVTRPSNIRNRSDVKLSREKKLLKEKNSSGMSKAFAMIAVLGVVYFGYEEFFKKKLKVDKRGPSSNVTKVQKTHQKKNANRMGTIFISNYDRRRHRVYLNGVKEDVSVVGEIKKNMGKYTLRVESPGKGVFVKKINLTIDRIFSISIPEREKVSYGFLKNVSDKECQKGTLFFTLNGEDRIEKIPTAESRGIAIPIGKDLVMDYQKDGENIKRKMIIHIKNENDIKDFCEL